MARELVESLYGPFQHAYGLLSRFIDTCPDAILAEKNGGWPVWQQVYHAVNAVAVFASNPDTAAAACPPLFDQATGLLQQVSDQTCSKKVLQERAIAAKKLADAFAERLDDAQLTAQNATLSQILGNPVNHATTLAMLTSHTMYHLGSCDAALRDHGLPGVF